MYVGKISYSHLHISKKYNFLSGKAKIQSKKKHNIKAFLNICRAILSELNICTV